MFCACWERTQRFEELKMNQDQTNGQTTATAGTETATSAKHTCTVCGYKAEGTNFMVPKFEEVAEAAGVSMRDLTAEMVVAQAVCKRCVGQNGLWEKGYKFTLSSALAQLEKRTAERAVREAIEAERKAEAEARQAKIDAEQAEIAAKHQAWRKSALTCVVCKDLDDADHGATPDFGSMRESLDRAVKPADLKDFFHCARCAAEVRSAEKRMFKYADQFAEATRRQAEFEASRKASEAERRGGNNIGRTETIEERLARTSASKEAHKLLDGLKVSRSVAPTARIFEGGWVGGNGAADETRHGKAPRTTKRQQNGWNRSSTYDLN
jgi:hypothetical protein